MLYEMLKSLTGCKIAHVTFLTPVSIGVRYAANTGLSRNVTKRWEGEVQLNYSYENAVNNRLEKQGDERSFKAKSLPWGEWDMPNKTIIHKGEYYMRYYLFNGNKPKVEYLVDGRPATEEEVALIKGAKKPKESKRQADAGLSENQVSAQAIMFSNILEVRVDGQTYSKYGLGQVG